jgi:hypothetical protein
MKNKYYFLIFLALFFSVICFSQIPPGLIESHIVNKGILKIEPSTEVYFGNEYKNTGTHDNEGNLYLNHHFINDGTTSIPTSGITSFRSSVNDTLTISGTTGSINFYNLEINVTGATKKGVSVIDGFDLKIVNQLNLISGDLRLTGEAQLIQTHPGTNTNISTSGNLLRDQQGTSNVYGYNYWSAPVSNNSGSFSLNGGMFDGTDVSLNLFNPQQVLFNTGSPYNGIPAILDGSLNVLTPLYINDKWLYKYAPNTSGYAGWEQINKDTALSPGEGFTMKGTGILPQNYVFKGLPNDGTYSFLINSGEFALLGNPYPSALDIDQFITDNAAVVDKIQIWVDGGSTSHTLANYLGGYSVYNLTGGVGPSVISSISGLGSSSGIIPKQYLAVAQGFFVEAISDGTITFDNSQRVFQKEDGVDSNFYKVANTKDSNSQTDNSDSFIRIGYEDPELFHRQLLLGFLPNSAADIKFNTGYDAVMTDPREDELFYIIDNDLTKKYVIQGVGNFDNTYEFPIGITITQEGQHTIMLDAVENFNHPVYIKDSLLNTYYNLTESDFNLNLSEGIYLDRFYIVFQTNETLGNTTDIFANNEISAYYKNDAVIIKNKNFNIIDRVKIYNGIGQQIKGMNLQSHDDNIVIPFVHQKGIYIVLIESGQSKKTFKIIN